MALVRRVFTFGFGHPNANGYAVVYGKTAEECRQRMYAEYGNKWSMEYENEEQAGVEKYDLHFVKALGGPHS